MARPNQVKSIDANDRPRVKKIPALGAQISWMRHLTTRLAPLSLFKGMGKGAGLEGVLLASVPTMPVPLIKRGAKPGRMFGVKYSCLAAIPGGGEWPGQALQNDTIPQDTGGGWGWVGGKCAGVNKSPRDVPSSIKSRKR